MKGQGHFYHNEKKGVIIQFVSQVTGWLFGLQKKMTHHQLLPHVGSPQTNSNEIWNTWSLWCAGHMAWSVCSRVACPWMQGAGYLISFIGSTNFVYCVEDTTQCLFLYICFRCLHFTLLRSVNIRDVIMDGDPFYYWSNSVSCYGTWKVEHCKTSLIRRPLSLRKICVNIGVVSVLNWIAE